MAEEANQSLSDKLTPDLSARPAGWAGTGLLVGALFAFGAASGPLGWALTAVGCTLVACQFVPKSDKAAKLFALGAAVALGGALVCPPLALGLGIAGAVSGVISYEKQRKYAYDRTLEAVTEEHNVMQRAQEVQNEHSVWRPNPPGAAREDNSNVAAAQSSDWRSAVTQSRLPEAGGRSV